MLKPTVEVRNEGGVLVAEFWDCLRLDPNPVRDLRQHYESHLRSKGKPDLVVDMNGVVFAGSAALGGFLALNRLARQQGGRVVFCKVDENVLEVFQISKLAPMFTFVEDREAAFAFLAKPTDGPIDGTTTPVPPSNPSSPPASPRADGPLRRGRRRDP
jgi:anti-sigma B factor antagonist